MVHLKIYISGLKIALANRLAYRGDFFLSALIMLLAEFIIPLVTLLIYQTGAAFPGWTLYEVLLIQAIFLLAKGVAQPAFFGMIFNTLVRIREGTFDLLLIKPRSALFMSIVTAFDTEDIGKFIGGLTLFSYALLHLPFPGLWNWLQFFLLFLLSLVVLFSFAVTMAGTVFIWVGNSRVYEIFDCLTSFGLYPVSIFSKPAQIILTAAIPVAMIGFFPAAALLGKPTGALGITAIISLGFLILSLVFWKTMLKQHTSAGG
jgi:ABC-2 type transport system permease protein